MNTFFAARSFKTRLQNPYVGSLADRIHLPGEAGYDEHRLAWNLAVDLRPAAVVRPHSVLEVQSVVRAAVATGLRIAPISTGHGLAAMDGTDLTDVVLVRVDELTGVAIDPLNRSARVVGGTLWNDVIAAAAEHGLTALHGSAGDVAVVGFALGGGISFYGRKHGLAANSVRKVEIVDAAGELRVLSPTREPELFWAIRGGVAGNFGIVVAVEVDLLPYSDVYAGMLLFPIEQAAAVVSSWRDWVAKVPESVTTSLRVMSFPPLPELPPFLSGRRLVVIDGAILESDATAADLLAPLRILGPEMDTFGRIPTTALVPVHMDPPAPVPSVGDHTLLAELPDKALETLLDEMLPGNSLMFAELRQLGGALGRPGHGGGVLSHLDGEFALFTLAIAPTPEAAAAGTADARRLVEAMAPWSSGRCAPTFSDQPAEGPALWGGQWLRLRHAVSSIDPDGVFVANHRIH